MPKLPKSEVLERIGKAIEAGAAISKPLYGSYFSRSFDQGSTYEGAISACAAGALVLGLEDVPEHPKGFYTTGSLILARIKEKLGVSLECYSLPYPVGVMPRNINEGCNYYKDVTWPEGWGKHKVYCEYIFGTGYVYRPNGLCAVAYSYLLTDTANRAYSYALTDESILLAPPHTSAWRLINELFEWHGWSRERIASYFVELAQQISAEK